MTDAENPDERTADGLFEVAEAIRAVDYNALREADLAVLMDAHETVLKMTLRYRQDQHSNERRAP